MQTYPRAGSSAAARCCIPWASAQPPPAPRSVCEGPRRRRDPPIPVEIGTTALAIATVVRRHRARRVAIAVQRLCDVELNPLCKRQRPAVVDGVGCAPHVGLPRVRAGLAASTGVLLAAEGSADLGAGWP